MINMELLNNFPFFNSLGGFLPSILFSFGLALTMLELMVGGVFLLWFGFAALILSGIELFHPMRLTGQIILFSTMSFLLLVLYIMVIKPMCKPKSDMTDYFLPKYGEGIITNNMVEFDGSYWRIKFYDKKFPIKNGDKVYIKDIEGNIAKIVPIEEFISNKTSLVEENISNKTIQEETIETQHKNHQEAIVNELEKIDEVDKEALLSNVSTTIILKNEINEEISLDINKKSKKEILENKDKLKESLKALENSDIKENAITNSLLNIVDKKIEEERKNNEVL